MQPTNLSRRILLPARPWFIYLSLALALLLAYIPVGRTPGMPDWVALVLAFWRVREPQRVGLGVAFVFGLLVDIGHGAAMGQHALAYVLLAYFCALFSRRMLWFSLALQSLQVLPLLLGTQALMVAVRMLAGGEFPGWWIFSGPLVGTLLWVPLSYVLLLPQFQPVDRDENRPI